MNKSRQTKKHPKAPSKTKTKNPTAQTASRVKQQYAKRKNQQKKVVAKCKTGQKKGSVGKKKDSNGKSRVKVISTKCKKRPNMSKLREMLLNGKHPQPVVKLERCGTKRTSTSATSGGNSTVQLNSETVTLDASKISKTGTQTPKKVARKRTQTPKKVIKDGKQTVEEGAKGGTQTPKREANERSGTLTPKNEGNDGVQTPKKEPEDETQTPKKEAKDRKQIPKKKRKKIIIDRELPCIYCGKKFANYSRLERHTVSHTGEKKFFCFSCQRPFGRKDHMMRHYLGRCQFKDFNLAMSNVDVP